MFISNSAEETIAAGRRYGASASKGNVFALTGDLGAGKTQFVKGFVAGVGSEAEVTSPTFVLVHEYEGGRLPVYHFDFYRVEKADEIVRLGFDDYVFGDGVSLIEWADRYPDLIPKGATWISLETAGEFVRRIKESERSYMKILALELSSEQGSVAWLENDRVPFDRTFANNRKHSGLFFENLQSCLKQNGQPDAIVVGLGPGSYAGVRIAIATAVGVRAAAMAKLVGLPSICTIETEAQDYCVIGDARRDSFFFGRISDGRLVEGPSLHSSEELATRTPGMWICRFILPSLYRNFPCYAGLSFRRKTGGIGSRSDIRDRRFPIAWNRFIFGNLTSLCQKLRHELQPINEFRNGLPMLG